MATRLGDCGCCEESRLVPEPLSSAGPLKCDIASDARDFLPARSRIVRAAVPGLAQPNDTRLGCFTIALLAAGHPGGRLNFLQERMRTNSGSAPRRSAIRFCVSRS